MAEASQGTSDEASQEKAAAEESAKSAKQDTESVTDEE
jgi:hypothetical protein